MQQARGWSPLETGLAIFPAGLIVALIAPRIGPAVSRLGVTRLVTLGLLSTVGAYALSLPIGVGAVIPPWMGSKTRAVTAAIGVCVDCEPPKPVK